MYPHAKTEQLLLGVRERSFAYTQKVVWANANGCEKASCSLHKGTAHLFRLLRAPRLITSEQPSDYFVLLVCLLWINRLLLMSCKQRHLRVAPKSSLTCSEVICDPFRSHLQGVKWLGNGRKVTHHRLTGTSGTTQKYHIFHKSRHTYSEMKRKTIFRFAFHSTFRNSELNRARSYSVSAKKEIFSLFCSQLLVTL